MAGTHTLYADEAPRARAYHDWLGESLDRLDDAMPAISAAADAAAAAYVDGAAIGVRGDLGLADELAHRPGGPATYAGGEGEVGDVIIYALGVQRHDDDDVKGLLKAQINEAATLRIRGSVVIGIASTAQLRAHGLHEAAAAACTHVLSNHAGEHDGFIALDDGRRIVPTYTTMNAAVLWTFTAELFAACTRADKTPVFAQSMLVDTRGERATRYDGARFHDDQAVVPIEPGELGRAYLKALRANLLDLGTASWDELGDVAEAAGNRLLEEHTVLIHAPGVMVSSHHGGQLAADPHLFVKANDGRMLSLDPGLGQYMIAVGYAQPPGDDWWGEPDPRLVRDAEFGVAWLISGFLTRPSDLRDNETVIELHFSLDDAAVKVPGYDVRICPTSGVVTEAAMWMLTAQVWEHMHAPIPRRKPQQPMTRVGTD